MFCHTVFVLFSVGKQTSSGILSGNSTTLTNFKTAHVYILSGAVCTCVWIIVEIQIIIIYCFDAMILHPSENKFSVLHERFKMSMQSFSCGILRPCWSFPLTTILVEGVQLMKLLTLKGGSIAWPSPCSSR